jgi:hypothetical protein
MLRHRKTMTLATAALLLSDFSIATARAEETAVPKRSAYPRLEDKPSTSNKPRITATEQEKLKKELSSARDRQSQVRTKESASRAKAQKP